ncbi:sigma-70 family RNA polymerase sigma factor [Faecalimonas umbilicata]|nr:sigma-70 family RNA polymerase sigma factor [Faecalimonas umbilicata]
MNEKNIFTGSKIKNQFTAYLLSFIRGRRRDYLDKKIRIDHAEIPLEDFAITEMDMSMEEALDLRLREEMLLREAEGVYLQWDELSDQRLIGALMVLREDERKMIYQHVFEERTFEEMSLMSGLSVQRVKGIYYYAIRKIRKMMGGN